MKSFKVYITEFIANNGGNINYSGLGGDPQIPVQGSGALGFDFKGNRGMAGRISVADWWGKKEEMKPWQVRNADTAMARHEALKRWLAAVDEENIKAVAPLPDWQLIRKKK
jgi:hypothetical protein